MNSSVQAVCFVLRELWYVVHWKERLCFSEVMDLRPGVLVIVHYDSSNSRVFVAMSLLIPGVGNLYLFFLLLF